MSRINNCLIPYNSCSYLGTHCVNIQFQHKSPLLKQTLTPIQNQSNSILLPSLQRLSPLTFAEASSHVGEMLGCRFVNEISWYASCRDVANGVWVYCSHASVLNAERPIGIGGWLLLLHNCCWSASRLSGPVSVPPPHIVSLPFAGSQPPLQLGFNWGYGYWQHNRDRRDVGVRNRVRLSLR